MYNFIISLNTLIASLFLCIWFVIYTSVLTTKSKKDLIQLIRALPNEELRTCRIRRPLRDEFLDMQYVHL